LAHRFELRRSENIRDIKVIAGIDTEPRRHIGLGVEVNDKGA
jgi:hypothetical protein